MTVKEMLEMSERNKAVRADKYLARVERETKKVLREIERRVLKRDKRTSVRVDNANVRANLVAMGFRETSRWTSGTDKPWEMFYIAW